jgi:hypothetical protein
MSSGYHEVYQSGLSVAFLSMLQTPTLALVYSKFYRAKLGL